MKRSAYLILIALVCFYCLGLLVDPVPTLAQSTHRLQVISIKGQFFRPNGQAIHEYDYLDPGHKYRLLPKSEVQLLTLDGTKTYTAAGPGIVLLDPSGSLLFNGMPLNATYQQSMLHDVTAKQVPSHDLAGLPFRAIGVVPKTTTLGSKDRVLRALIIGINTFQDIRIRKLRFCLKDAEGVRDIFSDRRYCPSTYAEVQYLLGKKATLDRVRKGLEQLGDKAAPEDTVIVYFASHGIQQEGGRAFWVLHDSKVDRAAYSNGELKIVPQTALGQPEIQKLLNRIKARRVLVLVDSCFSAATVISYSRGKKFKVPEVRNPFDGFKGEGRVFLTASEGSQEAAELPDLGHGAFTYFLLEGLKGKADSNSDNVVELWEIWQYLDKKVTNAARKAGGDQRPTISSVYLTHGFPLTTYPLVDNTTHVKPSSPEWVDVVSRNGNAFHISSTEITNRQFLDFIRENPAWRKDRIASRFHDGDYLKHWMSPTAYPTGLGDHPVTYVSWFAAKAFAEWAGGRLPSESEWTAAASGDKSVASSMEDSEARLYPWGNQWNPALCNHRNGTLQGTAPVQAFKEGGSHWLQGIIYNMAGNAWEWCSDWVFEYSTALGKRAIAVVPVGPEKKPSLNRLIKGGSFLADRLGCMISSSVWADPRLCAEDGGFRVVKDEE